MKGFHQHIYMFALMLPLIPAAVVPKNVAERDIDANEQHVETVLESSKLLQNIEAEKSIEDSQNSEILGKESIPMHVDNEPEFSNIGLESTITTTTAAPRPNCPDEVEFFAAPQCEQYYQCYAGEGYLHTCPAGLFWNPKLSVCDWSDSLCDGSAVSSEPAGTSCSSGALFLPIVNDCRQYIQCAYGREFKRACPHGLYWQQTSMRCDYSREACK